VTSPKRISPAEAPAVYDRIARFYDLDHAGFEDDLAFYGEFARMATDPLLDVGVGSGRVAVPLALAGRQVTGIDPAEPMLALARRRAAAAGVEQRLTLVRGDAATVTLAERFGLAYFSLNTLSHMLSRPEQLAVLANVRRHLQPGGRLLIDQWNPHASTAPDSSGQWVFGYRRQAGDGHWVTQSVASTADPAEQVLRTTIVYDEEVPLPSATRRDGGAAVRRTTVTLRLRYFYRYEVEWLMLAAGYELEAVFGSYDLEPYDTGSPRLIWLARNSVA
jgi:ubiquinone/menaquinone biosynthesis C-methylase UbiE